MADQKESEMISKIARTLFLRRKGKTDHELLMEINMVCPRRIGHIVILIFGGVYCLVELILWIVETYSPPL